jgi:hypothetical protein
VNPARIGATEGVLGIGSSTWEPRIRKNVNGQTQQQGGSDNGFFHGGGLQAGKLNKDPTDAKSSRLVAKPAVRVGLVISTLSS